MRQPIYLTWLNHLGGFEYFLFAAFHEYNIEITESQTVRQNIFPQWPKSYGDYADTIDKQTFRNSKNSIVVRSQNVSKNQLQAISYIKSSAVVQVMNSRNDRRTVLVDTDSFKTYSDNDKIFTISFKISFTDEIPSQRA